ncbi:DEAD/DEAH box helicase [Saccharolobus islandicus]|uniref:RNA helicase n=1 Tax=Saccharolobus islandicus (strain L.D.8.5 / Lassen \|nr:DEAD/DEAH box helicase [Sulfolobus islandicus]ADB86534.1 type III restriction enzyme, res subunit [Sulfolobus islandicus L.D.8.5]
MPLDDLNKLVRERLGIETYPYQKYISEEIEKNLDRKRFIIISMPTGSGKTLIELSVAYHLINKVNNIIVLEPTRLLCDQMYHRFWRKVFGDNVGVEYEGNCESFEKGKKIIVSTPFTTAKCLDKAEAMIIDEVHHAFGDARYEEILVNLEPRFLIGFTALLPSYKKYLIDPRLIKLLGQPEYLVYDFKSLTKIDPSFKLPKAIADIFDSEFNNLEDSVYEAFFKGLIKGNKETIKFLELTFYTYGKEAFCESYRRLIGKVEESPYIDSICDSKDLSHKARALRSVLNIYRVEEFKPVLIFTSRKSTAYEFERAISDLGKVKVITGDSSRYERLKVVQNLRKGEIDVLISTIVGEEGIDIPEAKLLIMTDVPQSALRFYQRLGRLIRGKEKEEGESAIKYLVVTLTPKTSEYDNLDEALRNLYLEGVDVSYLIDKREDKGPVARVVEIINKSGGQVLINQIDDTKKKSNLSLLSLLESNESKSHVDEYIDRTLRDGKALYYYDEEMMGKLASQVLLGSYCNIGFGETYMRLCNSEYKKIGEILLRKKGNIKLDRKSSLRPFMKLFLSSNLNEVMKELSEKKSKYEKELEGKDYNVEVHMSKIGNGLLAQILISASVDSVTVNPKIQINYYDLKDEKLVKLNSLLIAYSSLINFYKLTSTGNGKVNSK